MESAGNQDLSSFGKVTLLQPLELRFVWHAASLQCFVDDTVSHQRSVKRQQQWKPQEIKISPVLRK